jgi:hypothetical protein
VLREDHLRWLAEIAAYKASEDGIVAPGVEHRPAGIAMIEDRATGFVPPLTELIAARVTDPVRRHLDPPKSAPVPPSGKADAVVVDVGGATTATLPAPAPPPAQAQGTPVAAAPPLTGVLVDLRSAAPEQFTDLTARVARPPDELVTSEGEGTQVAIAPQTEEGMAHV